MGGRSLKIQEALEAVAQIRAAHSPLPERGQDRRARPARHKGAPCGGLSAGGHQEEPAIETRPAPTGYVGVDIAAATLAVVLSPAPTIASPAQTFANTAAGWRALQAHMAEQGAVPITTQLIMEAMGASWQGLATALTAAGWTVSVVSPASARDYAKAIGRRAKTDRVDATVLASYGRALQPALWHPAATDVQVLQLLIRQRDDLVALQMSRPTQRYCWRTRVGRPRTVRSPSWCRT